MIEMSNYELFTKLLATVIFTLIGACALNFFILGALRDRREERRIRDEKAKESDAERKAYESWMSLYESTLEKKEALENENRELKKRLAFTNELLSRLKVIDL